MNQPQAPSPPPDITRASLLIRLNQNGKGRDLAWEEFVAIYAPVIRGFARRLGTPPQEIEDLLQEVLGGFFRAAPEFVYQPGQGRFRAYLKTCVVHKLAQQRRGRRPDPAQLDPDAVSVEAVWEDVWETQRLYQALSVVKQRYATNPERQRTFRAFELAVLLEHPTEKVAIQLGLSAEAVRQAKTRVGKALKETFDTLYDLAE